MFDLPDAKRVRREDLYDSVSDEERSSDGDYEATLREKLNAQLSGLLDLSSTTVVGDTETTQSRHPHTAAVSGDSEIDHHAEQPDEEVFAFRLFRDDEPSRQVVLSNDQDEALQGAGGFVIPKRPRSYYISGSPSPELSSQFERAAVSAEYLIEDSRRRRWGLEKPWRVITITVASDQGDQSGDPTSQSGEKVLKGKKKRPGKKRRITLRIREKAKKERDEAIKQQSLDKEQHLKDKKARLNRERKLKRRAKAREQKQQDTQVGEIPDDTGTQKSSPVA
ncbi:hypothetical protein F5Y15DRAFT_330478 [Xylariaceae sp. FL0016]|nr:hypothetical protein F5Y15DRAFT_330478 [Xylariaceae sp. FL0016]